MKRYIGTKILHAQPMTRAQYNTHRGWTMPIGEDGRDAGYLVEYRDGYISWSPAPQFEEAYRPSNAMTFGLAMEALKQGLKVARAGWNGKGMWLTYVSANSYQVPNLTSPTRARPFGLDLQPFIGMKTAQDMFVPWLASQSDMLAEDWRIVE